MAFQPFDLTGRVALITGGNGGIGLGMARGMAQAGAEICIWGTNPDKNAAALELNPKHVIIKGIERLRRDESEEKVRIAKLLAEQVFDNARVAAGALDDPREMVGRIHEILEVALRRVGEDDEKEEHA